MVPCTKILRVAEIHPHRNSLIHFSRSCKNYEPEQRFLPSLPKSANKKATHEYGHRPRWKEDLCDPSGSEFHFDREQDIENDRKEDWSGRNPLGYCYRPVASENSNRGHAVEFKNLTRLTIPFNAEEELALSVCVLPARPFWIEISRAIFIYVFGTTQNTPTGFLPFPKICHLFPPTNTALF